MLSRYRHVIWDWNGTLLDDLDYCIGVMNALLQRRGLPLLDRARYHELFDFPVRDYYGRLGLDVAGNGFEQLSVEFIAGYEARRLEPTLHAGAAEILNVVTGAGLTQSILSAYHHKTLQEVVTHFGLGPHFIRLNGLGHIHADSKVALGRTWLAELGLPRQDVLMVGDTLHDLEVAHDLGIDCVLVAAGHHSAARLRAKYDRVFESLTALCAAFQTIEAGSQETTKKP
jgi:phosphoglycolate phosphatase